MPELKAISFTVTLISTTVEIKELVVSENTGDQYKAISKTDITMRGVTNSLEILGIIPSIVIGQHQGDGKAEQIFLRLLMLILMPTSGSN
ncbi:MAG: hypothetical protein H7258_15370 [Ferruginibacter sp.]|nr:hypothetical protein [Ferruginibacter sp.]